MGKVVKSNSNLEPKRGDIPVLRVRGGKSGKVSLEYHFVPMAIATSWDYVVGVSTGVVNITIGTETLTDLVDDAKKERREREKI